ncbi:hypothetical protein JH138_003783, partial [Acinetobacter baumannii]
LNRDSNKKGFSLKIKSLYVDFTGSQNIQSASNIQNEYLELLQEAENADDEHISAAIQQFCDEKSNKDSKQPVTDSTKIISVFLNKEFYKNFELQAEVCVIHTATAIEGLQ